MNLHTIWTVMFKELRELSRDRKTMMLTLVLGPVLVPALMLGMWTMMEKKQEKQLDQPLSVAIVGAERAPNLVAWLAGEGITRKDVADPDAAIRAQDEDVYLHIGKEFPERWQAGEPALIEVVFDSTRQDAQIPVKRLKNALQQYGQLTGSLRLLARGVNPGLAAPMVAADKDLSTPESRRSLAAALLPYFLILGSFLGGAALVIDTTAGERERQSLEPLMATPTRRSSLVTGKTLAASLLGMLALVLTLLMFKLGAQFSPGVGRQMDVSFGGIAKMILILLPMLLIGTTLLTWIAAGAKSVKEAQSYMSMLMMLPIIPSVLLMVSPVKNQLWMFAVPFLAQNQMLLKVIRSETIEPMLWLVYLVAGFGLAALLWFAAIRRYEQEKLAISA